ncbi:MAG: glycine cleavage system protein GcvH [Promethearchaeota archaeon]
MEYKIPTDLKYAKTHEWAKVINEKTIAIVGITDYAQYQLGDIVYIELPQVGSTFKKGDVLTELESVKAVEELFMPLTGEILEVNKDLEENPEYINNSPYEHGWIVRIAISNLLEIEELLTAEKYSELIEKEEH